MKSLINLPNTLNLIKIAWTASEKRVCSLISTKYFNHDETFITRLLIGEIRETLNEFNEKRLFEINFLKDLELFFDDTKLKKEIVRLSKNLIARITYHEPEMEKISGADFGLAVIRPNVSKIKQNRLKESMHKQGLLCQAKRQKDNGKMGTLTDHQKEIAPSCLKYYSIVLYTYSDKNRKNLQPFSWSNHEWDDIYDIEDFLKYYEEEDKILSDEIIEFLGRGEIGTGDQNIINSIICPDDTTHLKIEVTWSTGNPDPPPDDPDPLDLFRKKTQRTNIHRQVHRPPVQHVKTIKHL